MWERAARWYDLLFAPLDLLLLRRWRRRAVDAVPAGTRLLEVGAGTARNAPFHPAATFGVMTDISVAMLAVAGRRTDLPREMRRVAADVQRLPFRDRTFGVSLATLVFCEVNDPLAGLLEIQRVLAPGGSSVFLEHVRPDSRVAAVLFDLLNLVTSRFGEHVNRNTVATITRAGYRMDRVESGAGTVIRLIIAARRESESQ